MSYLPGGQGGKCANRDERGGGSFVFFAFFKCYPFKKLSKHRKENRK